MIEKLFFFHSSNTNPYHNLATEYYLLQNIPANALIFYLWQNRHTVVIGKHQNPFRECKVNQLLQEQGFVARRISGGGAVYQDLGNLNFTFLTQRSHFSIEKQTNVICQALKTLGLNAQPNGRNDITISYRKVSGNAYYQEKENCYQHGTILVNVDIEKMVNLLTVNVEKMTAHSVTSVKSRVVNIKELQPDITQEKIIESLCLSCSQIYGLPLKPLLIGTEAQGHIKNYEDEWSSDSFLFGRQTSFQHQKEQKFEWGMVELQYSVCQGLIDDVVIYSDTLDTIIIPQLTRQLKGLPLHSIHTLSSESAIVRDILSLFQ